MKDENKLRMTDTAVRHYRKMQSQEQPVGVAGVNVVHADAKGLTSLQLLQERRVRLGQHALVRRPQVY